METEKEERPDESTVLEEVTAQNSTNSLKDTNLQFQDAYHTTIKMNTKKTTLWHVRVKRASLESSKRKMTRFIQRNSDTISGLTHQKTKFFNLNVTIENIFKMKMK